ncbi:MAG: 4Fe-4S dicluster domain-containing protein [Desulfurococcaceae archaeon]
MPIALKKGTATVKYPFEKPLITESFRGAISVDPVKCTGCGACTRICPPKALTLVNEETSVVLRYFIGRCIFCGMCAEVCPEKAISVTKEFELASTKIDDLREDVVHDTITCRKCGKKFTTKKLYVRVAESINVLSSEIMDLCPDCRRIETLSKATLAR